MNFKFTDSAELDWLRMQERAKVETATIGVQMVELTGKMDLLLSFPRMGARSRLSPGNLELVTEHIRLVYRLDEVANTIDVLAVRDCREHPISLRRLG